MSWIKRHKVLTVLIGLVVIIGIASAAGGGSGSSDSGDKKPAASPTPIVREVIYFVEGDTTSASLTMSDGRGGTKQITDARVPLVNQAGTLGLRFKMLPGAFFYISAQNGKSYGDVSCRVTIDGQRVSEQQAQGGYAIASCSGTVR